MIKREKDIADVWHKALRNVVDRNAALIEAQQKEASRIQTGLVKTAKREMDREKAAQQSTVSDDLKRTQEGVVADLRKDLARQAKTLEGVMRNGMDATAVTLARNTIREFNLDASKQSQLASDQIRVRATDIAKRTAGQMLLNSAWLIPMFFALALFLAMLTARSLV